MGKFIGGFVVGVISIMVVGACLAANEAKAKANGDQPNDNKADDTKPE